MSKSTLPHSEIVRLAEIIAPEFDTVLDREQILERAFGSNKEEFRRDLSKVFIPLDTMSGFIFAEQLLYCLNKVGGGLETIDGENAIALFLQAIIKANPSKSNIVEELEYYLRIIAGHRCIRGLSPYRVEDSDFYFGRENDIKKIIRLIEQNSFTLIYGPSGCGKSSLVNAGILGQLNIDQKKRSEPLRNKDWKYISFQPKEKDKNPFLGLLSCFIKNERDKFWGYDYTEKKNRNDLSERIFSDIEKERLIIYIDQLEELFTVVRPHSEPIFKAFCEYLVELAGYSSKISILSSIRADYIGMFLEPPVLSTLVAENAFILSIPNDTDIHQMIVGPVETSGLRFEEGVDTTILLQAHNNDNPLPLVAYTIALLYDNLVKQNTENNNYRIQFTMSDFEKLGSVAESIGRHAKNVFAQLTLEAQKSLGKVFRELVFVPDNINNKGITKRRADYHKFKSDPASFELVEALIQARLLDTHIIQKNDNIDFPSLQDNLRNTAVEVEITHEAILRHWDDLRTWLEEFKNSLNLYQRWQQAVIIWVQNGKRLDYRWQGDQREKASEMVDELDLHNELTPDQYEFIYTDNADYLYKEVLEELEQYPKTSHQKRRDMGIQLSRDDKRPGIHLDTLYEAWCPVDAEPNFHIAKYPVTVAQYRAFCEAEEKAMPKDNPFDNYPVVNVTWQDAVDFCEWVTKQSVLFPIGCNSNEWQIRLPTAEEWLLAMNGGDETRRFPWEGDWKEGKCNTKESGLGQVIAVGMYPQGAAPCGAMDMFGNVWEWTATLAVGMENYIALACGYSSRHSYLEPISNYPNSKSLDKNKFPDDFPIGFRLACCKS